MNIQAYNLRILVTVLILLILPVWAMKEGLSPRTMVRKGYKQTLLGEIKRNPDVIKKVDEKGETLLHMVVRETSKTHAEELICLLVSKGVALNAPSKKGLAPLALAVVMGLDTLVELLTRYGVSPYVSFACENKQELAPNILKKMGLAQDKQAQNGKLELDPLVILGKMGVFELAFAALKKAQECVDRLFEALRSGQESVLEQYAHPHGKHTPETSLFPGEFLQVIVDKNGDTPLHVALFSGHKKLACMLVERGCSLLALSSQGKTALQYATDRYACWNIQFLEDLCAAEQKWLEGEKKRESSLSTIVSELQNA